MTWKYSTIRRPPLFICKHTWFTTTWFSGLTLRSLGTRCSCVTHRTLGSFDRVRQWKRQTLKRSSHLVLRVVLLDPANPNIRVHHVLLEDRVVLSDNEMEIDHKRMGNESLTFVFANYSLAMIYWFDAECCHCNGLEITTSDKSLGLIFLHLRVLWNV